MAGQRAAGSGARGAGERSHNDSEVDGGLLAPSLRAALLVSAPLLLLALLFLLVAGRRLVCCRGVGSVGARRAALLAHLWRHNLVRPPPSGKILLWRRVVRWPTQ